MVLVDIIKVEIEDDEDKLNEMDLKRKREEDKYKGLSHKQKKLMQRLDKEKKMKSAKKKAAELLVTKKARKLVEKDLHKLRGEQISDKIKKDFYKRILEVVTKICLFIITGCSKFIPAITKQAVAYMAKITELIN